MSSRHGGHPQVQRRQGMLIFRRGPCGESSFLGGDFFPTNSPISSPQKLARPRSVVWRSAVALPKRRNLFFSATNPRYASARIRPNRIRPDHIRPNSRVRRHRVVAAKPQVALRRPGLASR